MVADVLGTEEILADIIVAVVADVGILAETVAAEDGGFGCNGFGDGAVAFVVLVKTLAVVIIFQTFSSDCVEVVCAAIFTSKSLL